MSPNDGQTAELAAPRWGAELNGRDGLRIAPRGRPRPGLRAVFSCGRPRWRNAGAEFAMLGLFIAVLAIQLWHHEMWRDETNPWGLVLASRTLAELFHNLHYEGHPALWYLLLKTAALFSRDPVMIKVVHGTIAAAVAAMIALRSPFSRREKLLLLLNFFVLWEYAVVSRNYGIGLLLALIYAELRVMCPERLLLNAALLGALANTNIYAWILSVALAVEYLIDRLTAGDESPARIGGKILPAALLYIALAGFAVVSLAPAADISARSMQMASAAQLDFYHVKKTLVAYLVMPFLPALYAADFRPAGGSLLYQMIDIQVVALPFVLGTVIVIFRRDKYLLLMLGMAALGAMAFGQFFYFGHMRHWGIVFVAFLVALWMQRIRRPTRYSVAVTLFLAFGAVTGVAVSARAWMDPYSNAGPAARWITAHGLRDAALIGTDDSKIAGVAIYLGAPIYFLDCSCTDSYLRFSNRRDGFDPSQIPRRLALAWREVSRRPMILLLDRQSSGAEALPLQRLGLRLSPLAAFVGSQTGDDFFIYRVDADSAVASSPS